MRSKYLIATLVLATNISIAQNISQSVLDFADKQVATYAEDYPGVSVSIAQGNTIVWNKTLGYEDLENQSPVTRNTRFNIYSTSKLITGLAFLKLVQDGTVESVGKKIREIDPTLPESYSEITIKHLLTHTSGIRHYQGRGDWKQFSDLRCANPEAALQHFINDPLKHKPGEKYLYTTYGMVLASHLLEKITGKEYIDALNALLPFGEPLVLDSDEAIKATPYVKRRKSFDVFPGLSAECKYGGGGLIASSDQLAQAGQLLYNGKLAPLDKI